MKKVVQKHKKNKINILLTVLASVFGFLFFLIPLLSIIGNVQNKRDYHKIFDNTTSSQTSTKGTVKYVTDDPDSNQPYLCKVDENGNLMDDFKIMVSTDMHMWNGSFFYDLQIGVLSNLIDLEKPDLVVLDGDLLCHPKYTTDISAQQALVKMFESKKQYWTFVLGNHDGQNLDEDKPTRRNIAFDTLCGKNFDHTGEKSPYCLADTKVAGTNGTNYINIRGKDKKIIQTLFFFDCYTIGSVNPTVINWYNQSLNEIKNDNGGVLPKSIAFNHKPFYEMRYAWLNDGKDPNVEHIGGFAKEEPDDFEATNGLFDAFINGGSTKAIISGHEHLNNVIYKYKDIRMQYSCGLQYTFYNSRLINKPSKCHSILDNFAHLYSNKYDCYIDGATDIFIKDADTEPEYGNIYTKNTNVFKGWEFKLAFWCASFFTHPSIAMVWIHRINLIIVWGGVITCITFLVIRKKKHIK